MYSLSVTKTPEFSSKILIKASLVLARAVDYLEVTSELRTTLQHPCLINYTNPYTNSAYDSDYGGAQGVINIATRQNIKTRIHSIRVHACCLFCLESLSDPFRERSEALELRRAQTGGISPEEKSVDQA